MVDVVQNIVNSVKNKTFGARIFEVCFSCFDVVVKIHMPLECLNSYHFNIIFTVKKNPDHFLDTALSYNKFSYIEILQKKTLENYQPIGNQKSLPNGKEIA